MINKQYFISKDTYVNDQSPSTPQDTNTSVFFGNSDGFDLYGYLSATPITMVASTPVGLDVDFYGYCGNDATGIDIYPLNEDWDEGIVWNDSQPEYLSATPIVSSKSFTFDAWNTFDLTSTAQNWLDGTWTNHGMVFRDGSAYGGIYSSNYTLSRNLTPYILMNGTFGAEEAFAIPTHDTYIDESNPTANQDSATSIKFGLDSGGDETRILLKIDDRDIDRISNLYQCTIALYVTSESVENSEEVIVKSIDESWDSTTVTWNTKPSTGVVSNRYPLGTNTGQLDISGTGEIRIDITDIVQHWANGNTNNGIEISLDGGNSDEVTVDSIEGATVQQRPYLYLDSNFQTVGSSRTEDMLEDTYTDDGNGDTNYSSSTTLKLGTDGTDTYRTYFKVDDTFVDSITSLNKAKLHLYVISEDVEATEDISIWAIDESWDSTTLTFNNAPSSLTIVRSLPLGTGNGQINPTAGAWLELDVTEAFSHWIDDSNTNNGFYFKLNGTSGSDEIEFASLEYTDSQYKPYLTVDADFVEIVEAESMVGEGLAATPIIQAGALIESESCIGIGVAATPIVQAGVVLASTPMIAVADMYIPDVKVLELVQAEPMIGIGVASTPIVSSGDLFYSAVSMVGNAFATTPVVTTGTITMQPPSGIGISDLYEPSTTLVFFSEAMVGESLAATPIVFTGFIDIATPSMVSVGVLQANGAIPMKEPYKHYIWQYSRKYKPQLRTPSKLVAKNYGTDNQI